MGAFWSFPGYNLTPDSQANERTTPASSTSGDTGKYEFLDKKFVPSMICTNNQCMLIGSYGDKYTDKVKADLSRKKTEKGGQFLSGVSDDLEQIQDMMIKDPRKTLAYVLSDVPGAQRPVASYLAKIEKLLKESKDCGVMIWYTGHGQKDTGNWCFTDGFITFDQIFNLYEQHFRGKLLTLVCDTCFSGQWVCRFAEILDAKGIGACGHKARDKGYLIKIFAACMPNESAYDTLYVKRNVNVDPTNSLMHFYNYVKLGEGAHTQTPVSIDSTQPNCFCSLNKSCEFDQIPSQASWKWKDFSTRESIVNLKRRLFIVWSNKNGIPVWIFLLVYKDKYEDFCAFQDRSYDVCKQHGHIVFEGPEETQSVPEDIYALFCSFGPIPVSLPKTKTDQEFKGNWW